MNNGQRTVASLVAAWLVLLAGCSIGTLHRSTGKKLPNSQTALIKLGHGVESFGVVDGWMVAEQAVLLPIPITPWGAMIEWRRESVRVLPGTHDVEVRNRSSSDEGEHVIFDTEAGESYTVHWDIVEEVDYIWIENKSGSVVAGAKPPEE